MPRANAACGITLAAWPAWIMPTETTTAWVGSDRRLTTCWRATTVWQRATTRVGGELGVAGVPAGAVDRDLEVVGGGVDGADGGRDRAGRELMLQVDGDDRARCCAARAPDGTMSLRPGRDGLLARLQHGEQRDRQLASRSACLAARQNAVSAARCTSWPQACIAPVTDAHGAPVCSVIGSASSSARSAMHGPSWPPIRDQPAGTGDHRSVGGAECLGDPGSPSGAPHPDTSGCACSSCRSAIAASSSAGQPGPQPGDEAPATAPGGCGVRGGHAGQVADDGHPGFVGIGCGGTSHDCSRR